MAPFSVLGFSCTFNLKEKQSVIQLTRVPNGRDFHRRLPVDRSHSGARMSYAAVKFRDRVFTAEYHCDALRTCLECPDWPESWDTLAEIIDGEKEPLEFGRVYEEGRFTSFAAEDQECRKGWYKSDRIGRS